MKQLGLTGFFLMTMIFPLAVRGEDSTLLLTISTEIKQTPLKNELRIGLWKEGKDGFDSLDVQAMLNGLFDAYFETPSSGGSNYFLWWDIRSLNPLQEWKLHVKSPPSQPIGVEWKQIPYETGKGSILYRLLDPETGRETDLDNGSGTLSLSISGSKTLILKSYLR